jgi:hypothetical protein
MHPYFVVAVDGFLHKAAYYLRAVPRDRTEDGDDPTIGEVALLGLFPPGLAVEQRDVRTIRTVQRSAVAVGNQVRPRRTGEVRPVHDAGQLIAVVRLAEESLRPDG